MDAEEFQAWKDSAATQWVLLRVAGKAALLEAGAKERLYRAEQMSAADWANLQSFAAHERGIVIGMNYVVGLELSDIDDERNKPD